MPQASDAADIDHLPVIDALHRPHMDRAAGVVHDELGTEPDRQGLGGVDRFNPTPRMSHTKRMTDPPAATILVSVTRYLPSGGRSSPSWASKVSGVDAVVSADGTAIAFERVGAGPAVVVVPLSQLGFMHVVARDAHGDE